MKHHYPAIFIFLCFFSALPAQEWRYYAAADGLKDFEQYQDYIWTLSGSGLSRININTGEIENWNPFNSDIPELGYNVLTIDMDGAAWLGGINNKRITRFDGNDWTTFSDLAGFPINTTLDIATGTDGKVWIIGHFDSFMSQNANLFYYENETFQWVPPPNDSTYIMTGTAVKLGIGADGHLWSLLRDSSYSEVSLGEFDGSNWTIHDMSPYDPNFGPGDEYIIDNEGNLYILVASISGPNFLKYDGDEWTFMEIPTNANNYANQERAMYMDDNNLLWIGLWDNTFLRYDGQTWDTLSLSTYGLTYGLADGLFIDEYDQHWVFYEHGDQSFFRRNMLYKYDGSTAHPIDLGNSKLPYNDCFSVIFDAQNNKWIHSRFGTAKFDGTNWINISAPILSSGGSHTTDKLGHIWFTYGNKLGRYDGYTITQLFLTNSQGEPYNWLGNIAFGHDGKLHLATNQYEILVLDEGSPSYLQGMQRTVSGIPLPDKSEKVRIGPSGTLYNMGYSIGQHEGNDSWINLFEGNYTPNILQDIRVSPDENIWLYYGPSPVDQSYNILVYNGIDWNEWNSPFNNISTYPQWDSEGHLWVVTESGLCKREGNNWLCYNENNSPLAAGQIRSFSIDKYNNFWIILNGNGLVLFNENQIENIEGAMLPEIYGHVYRDYNQNEILDDNDLSLAMQKVLILPDSIITFTNQDGSYRVSLPPESYEVQFIAEAPWIIDNSPDEYDIMLTEGTQEGLDFRITPTEEICDLQIFFNEGFARCNRASNNWITYWNYGTQSENGKIVLCLDSKTSYHWANIPPDYQNQDTLIWNFSSLLPFESASVYVELTMPDETFLDSTIITKTFISKDELVKDSSIAQQILLCAYDPNDKQGYSNGEIQNEQSLISDPIEYTIRFQNTGNDTAFTVVIRDTLSPQLDWNTFEIIGASHPFVPSLDSRGAVAFLFENIMLPDSNVNEAASHGFVSYMIKAEEEIESPSIIENTAYIYFDLNPPIVTNTTKNTLVETFVGAKNTNKEHLVLSAFPNPTSSTVFLLSNTASVEKFQYQIVDARGVIIQKGQWNNSPNNSISLKFYPSGIYFIKVENDNKVGNVRVVKH